MRKWFYREWWAYVLDDSRADKAYGPFIDFVRIRNPWTDDYFGNPFARFANWLLRCRCRAKGHPCGVFWNSGGYEPDMHCVDCGEDLG